MNMIFFLCTMNNTGWLVHNLSLHIDTYSSQGSSEDLYPFTTFFAWLLFIKMNHVHIQSSPKMVWFAFFSLFFFSWGKSTGAFCFSIINSLENLQFPLVLFVMQTACLLYAERLRGTWCRREPVKKKQPSDLFCVGLYCTVSVTI